MNINRGFRIDDPDVFVRWSISERKLESLLGNRLRRAAYGYYVISCQSLGGLQHELGFHFEPEKGGRLQELDFFRKNYSDLRSSFDEFQEYFEREFGPPTETMAGSEGFPSYQWHLKHVTIHHYVIARFGLEEHTYIKRDLPRSLLTLNVLSDWLANWRKDALEAANIKPMLCPAVPRFRFQCLDPAVTGYPGCRDFSRFFPSYPIAPAPVAAPSGWLLPPR